MPVAAKSHALMVAVPRSVAICAVPNRTPVTFSEATRAQSWLCIAVVACDMAKKASEADIAGYVALVPSGQVAMARPGASAGSATFSEYLLQKPAIFPSPLV